MPVDDIGIALDVAATELYTEGKYTLKGEGLVKTAEEMVEYYLSLVNEYSLLSIEDGLAEEDWEGWALMTKELGKRCSLWVTIVCNQHRSPHKGDKGEYGKFDTY